jgi:hypothetical protein
MIIKHGEAKCYIYPSRDRFGKWKVSIVFPGNVRKGAVFYSEQEALNWIKDYLACIKPTIEA